MQDNSQPDQRTRGSDTDRSATPGRAPAESPITPALLAATTSDLPTIEEIERFAAGGQRPHSCPLDDGECAAKILLTLTRTTYRPDRAAALWRAVVDHADWMTDKLGRPPGISVAALDYLTNVSNEWDHAVVTERAQIEHLADAASLDGLTGLYTRDFFDQWLAKAVAESRRYGDALALLMADIDDFKRINDTHGHLTGDRVLAEIGRLMLNNLRTADLAARYGGEELAAVLPHTTCPSAATVAEKIRLAVARQSEERLRVTLSIGVACWQTDMNDPDDLVRAADRALYAAKAAGKNRVVAVDNTEAPPGPEVS